MNLSDPGWIGGMVAVAVVLGGKVFEWVRDWRKARNDEKSQDKAEQRADDKDRAEQSIRVNEQAVGIYKEIIEQVRVDMAKLVEYTHIQDKQILECREEKIGLKVRVDFLTTEVEGLRKLNRPGEVHT